ncbi:MAG: hypothetical protein U0457_19105 [Candidatus Sericytochromatia bacterium]
MDESFEVTINYLESYPNYFWRWNDNFEVIEWINSTTIAYRDEIINLFNDLEVNISFSTILLILSATKDNWFEKKDSYKKIFNFIKARYFLDKELLIIDKINRSFYILDIIAKLPKELVKNKKLAYLIQEIFIDYYSDYENKILKNIATKLENDKINYFLSNNEKIITLEKYLEPLEQLISVFDKFKNEDELLFYLKTGIYEEPINTIDKEEEIITKKTLFEELEEDSQTIGLSKLAKQLLHFLNLSLKLKKIDNYDFEGYSDISNKGSLDRLLLSELANENDLFTARLVNNELLYIKKETPPADNINTKVIFIDSTLKMWGVNRIFAISSAISIAYNNNSVCYLLGEDSFHKVDMSNKKGIIEALSYLDIGLSPLITLKSILKSNYIKNNDFIFITNNENKTTYINNPIFSEIKKYLNFLLSVDITGELEIYQILNNNITNIKKINLDIDYLLFNQNNKIKNDRHAFFKEKFPPLYIPNYSMDISYKNAFYLNEKEVIIINNNHLFFIKTIHNELDEIINYIEDGDYYFANHDNFTYILVYNQENNLFIIYKLDFYKNYTKHDFSNKFSEITIRYISFNNNIFYIETNSDSFFTIDCNDFIIVETNKTLSNNLIFKNYVNEKIYDKYRDLITFQGFTIISNFINNKNHKIKKFPETIFINEDEKICIANYCITLDNENLLLKKQGNMFEYHKTYHKTTEEVFLTRNKNTKFFKTTWEDGSFAIIDTRGFLHLKSFDANIPDISIVLKKGAISAWSSDGKTTGFNYFLKTKLYERISDKEFYEKYIQSFINRIIF